MSATKLHADDTPVPVLEPGKGRTKTGRLWTYVRDERPAGQATASAVWFAFTPDRSGKHPYQQASKAPCKPMHTQASTGCTTVVT